MCFICIHKPLKHIYVYNIITHLINKYIFIVSPKSIFNLIEYDTCNKLLIIIMFPALN